MINKADARLAKAVLIEFQRFQRHNRHQEAANQVENAADIQVGGTAPRKAQQRGDNHKGTSRTSSKESGKKYRIDNYNINSQLLSSATSRASLLSIALWESHRPRTITPLIRERWLISVYP